MERRDFIKTLAISGGVTTLSGCQQVLNVKERRVNSMVDSYGIIIENLRGIDGSRSGFVELLRSGNYSVLNTRLNEYESDVYESSSEFKSLSEQFEILKENNEGSFDGVATVVSVTDLAIMHAERYLQSTRSSIEAVPSQNAESYSSNNIKSVEEYTLFKAELNNLPDQNKFEELVVQVFLN